MLTRKKLIAAAIIVAAIAVCAVVLIKNPRVMRFIKREVVISIAGDVLLDRGVATAIEKNGAAYPYGGVAALFKGDDITVANLETPLTDAEGGAMKPSRFVFKASTDNTAQLKAAGFDVLMLANNHTMDYLSAGLSDTMAVLDGAGLLHAGAGENASSIKPCFIDKNGVRIGVLSYSSLPPEGFMFAENEATIAYARAGFLDDMKSDIVEAAWLCDFLLVYFHWGTEYNHDVNEMQIEIAHAAVDSGASAVIGTHPHVLQGKEIYNNAPIYYSVGNFVFDKQIPEGTDIALIVQLTVNRRGVIEITELPVIIENCRPQIADGDKAEEILANLSIYSQRFE